jgi:hypothetical protein
MLFERGIDICHETVRLSHRAVSLFAFVRKQCSNRTLRYQSRERTLSGNPVFGLSEFRHPQFSGIEYVMLSASAPGFLSSPSPALEI